MSPSVCIPCPGLCPTLPTCHLETGCEARRFERRFNLSRKISCGTVVTVPWIDRKSHRGKITPADRASVISERYPANIISSMLHSDSSRNRHIYLPKNLSFLFFPPNCPPRGACGGYFMPPRPHDWRSGFTSLSLFRNIITAGEHCSPPKCRSSRKTILFLITHIITKTMSAES